MNTQESKIFNIYYLNLAKVYEISMMINNYIPTLIKKEKNNIEDNSTQEINTKKIIQSSNEYLADITGTYLQGEKDSYSKSSKMIESLNIQTTKSILLREIVRRCISTKDFVDCEEGDLIKIDNVKLKILNEENLYQFKMLKGDTLKGLRVEGVEISNLISSMLQDYSYLLYGDIKDTEGIAKEVVIKIPMELNNEFESKYSVADLLIGSVSIIGVYKGKISEEFINSNTFTYLYELGQSQNDNTDKNSKVFQSKTMYNKSNGFIKPNTQGRQFEYVDIIAVIQDVNFKYN